MKMTRHFSRSEAIAEAKRVYGIDFANKVTIVHDGAFWVLSDKV